MQTLKIEIPKGFKIDNFDINSGVVKFVPIPKDIFERVKSLQDAISELGEKDDEVIELRKLENASITSHVLFRQQAVVISKALNEDWVADFSDANQTKYYPWFKFDSSAGGFVFDVCDCWHSGSVVGSRLCFKSIELAEYFGENFIEIHNKYLK